MNELQEELALLKKQYDEARLAILDRYTGRAPAAVTTEPTPARAPERSLVPPTMRAKYSAEEVEQALAKVIEAIRAGGPSGREGLRKGLGMDDKLLTKALHLGTDSDQLSIVGERRASKYVIPSAGQREGRVKRGRK